MAVVRIVGELAVHQGAEIEAPGPPVALGSRKERRLLALLAASRGRSVSAAEAVAELWGTHPPRRPEDNVAVLVSRLRAALGVEAVVGGRGGYRLGPGVELDLDAAARRAEEARRASAADAPARAVVSAERGLELLGRGEALAGEPDAEWIGAVRCEVDGLRRALRRRLAEAALGAGDPRMACAAAEAAAEDDPLDDTAARLLMAAHQAAGEPARALQVFERLRTSLAEELGVDPAPETRARHRAILRGERPAPGRPRPMTSPPAPGRPAAVGRARELAELVETWAAARRGEPALRVVVGEGGIGKTTLVEAFVALAECDGATILRARAHAAERSLFLQPVLDALSPVLSSTPPGELRRLAGPAAPVLVSLLPDLAGVLGAPVAGGEQDIARRRAFDALRGVLLALAAHRPVLLVLDDLHDAGAACAQFLHFVARRLGDAPVLLLAAVRDGEGDEVLAALEGVGDRLSLGPLHAEAVALLAARAGMPDCVEDILLRSRGHPLFVTEILRALAAGEAGVPGTLQEAVGARLRRLGNDVADALRAAAVLGSVPSPEIVGAMLDVPLVEVLLRFERAAAAHVLVAAASRYEFANDVVREIVYASTPGPRRTAHHRVAADLLADRPEAMARHAAEIGDVARAARAWLVAGQRALTRGAATDALALLDSALEAAVAADEPVLTGRVHLVRSRAMDGLADSAATEAGISAAISTARDEPASPGPGHAEGLPGPRLPADDVDDALRAAEDRIDRAAEAEVCGWRAVVASNRLRFAEALVWGRRGLAAARACGDEGALVAGLDGLKTASAYAGDFAAMRPVVAELEPLARRRSDRQVLFWSIFESALAMIAAGQLDEASARIAEAHETCRGGGLLGFEPWLHAHRALVARLQGRPDEAVAHGRAATGRDDCHAWWAATGASALGTALLARGGAGDVAEAAVVLAGGLAVAEDAGAEAYVLRCLAPLAEARGDPALIDRAERMLAAIDTPPGGAWFGGADTYVAVARACLARGEECRARAVLRPLVAAAQRHGWVPWQADTLALDGRVPATIG